MRIRALCMEDFVYSNTSQVFNHICDLLRPEIDAQSYRFGNPSSVAFWNYACTLTDQFLQDRVDSYLAEWDSFVMEVPEYHTFFLCYPNPSFGEIRLRLNGETMPKGELAIFDILGQKVFSEIVVAENSDEITVNPDLAPGVYVLKIGGHSQRIVRY